MRAIWSGALGFGLVNILIRVYSASDEHVLEFDMLHKKDLSPIRYARICKEDGQEIPYDQIVKGYEYQKGEYVVVEPEDFERANARKTKTIDIQCFISFDEVDPLLLSKPFYLEPDKKTASKAYAILREALIESNKVAVCRFVFRNKEHIGLIFAKKDVLILMQMRYHSEIRPFNELTLPIEKTSTKEVDMALKLIDQLTEPFKPAKYKDTYTEELQAVIEAKVHGKKPPRRGKAPTYSKSSDLMHLLKQSLVKEMGKPLHKEKRSYLKVPSSKRVPSKRKR